jgi:hypothetical protein
MKRSDIDENFYQKNRTSTKGNKKNHLNENDTFERKKKLAFKNYVKDLRSHEDDDEYY